MWKSGPSGVVPSSSTTDCVAVALGCASVGVGVEPAGCGVGVAVAGGCASVGVGAEPADCEVGVAAAGGCASVGVGSEAPHAGRSSRADNATTRSSPRFRIVVPPMLDTVLRERLPQL